MKPDAKDILCDSIYMKQSEQANPQTVSKLVAASGWDKGGMGVTAQQVHSFLWDNEQFPE